MIPQPLSPVLKSEWEETMNNVSYDSDQVYELWWLMVHTRHVMKRARARELLQYGITPEEVGVLFACQVLGSRAKPAELSRWLFREPRLPRSNALEN